ncbi:hypothetical protein L5515_017310 [Caenorhabditis briggsae]|uniref:Uncharacterized protein n=1 Tax=Caenorhabditis briggsae TaxID=6238 RepID=A0AAE9JR55_CAEBR|nr:hypothetical protein L5515_017310 [Caenorhabditis briggsae]
MVNPRKYARKSRDEDETHDRIRFLLNTHAPREDSPVPVSNPSSRPSTSNNSRKRRAVSPPSPPRRQQPTVSRPRRSARASAVRANQTMRRVINGNDSDEEEVDNSSTQATTSGFAPNEPIVRDDQAQNNTREKTPEEAIVKEESKEAENTFPERIVKMEPQITRERENVNPEQKNVYRFDQMEAKFENINMDVATHDNSNHQEEQGDEYYDVFAPEFEQPAQEMDEEQEFGYQIAAAVSPVPSQSMAFETAVTPPTQSAVDDAAPTSSQVMVPATVVNLDAPLTLSKAAELPQTQEPVEAAAQQPQQDPELAPVTPTPVVQVVVTPVVRLDRPQRPEYLNAERAALLQLPGRSNDFRNWNADDVFEWLGMLPNQSAAFQVLRKSLLEFDGSGDFLNQLLSGPESVKNASEMLNASILHCHTIRRHVAALENCLLEGEYTKAIEEYNKQNN